MSTPAGTSTTARPPHPVIYRAVRLFSPLMRPLAGRRFFPLWAVLRHRGRRTGAEYSVPIGLRRADGYYYIGLPFGEATQWVQNVLAAGSCTVHWRGTDLQLVDPLVVDAEAAAAAFPAVLRSMMRMVGATSVLRLRGA